MQYEDFEIKIETEAENQHTVSVIRTPSGEALTALQFGLSDAELSQQLATLEQLLDPHETAGREDEQAIAAFGGLLFAALMRDELRSLYDRSRLIARNRDKGLRLKLRIQPARLAALPWELLYDEREGDYVCLSRNMSLVRYMEVARAVEPIAVTPPLQILGMVCSPKNLLPLDVMQEKQRVEQAVERLRSQGLVNLTWLQGETWRDLMRAMRRGSWHIFHYIGHSGFDEQNDEGYISFCNSDGNEDRLNATQLGRLLRDHKSLQLALLNSCQGAKVGEEIFSSTASTLVRQGIPCVIAMQYDVSDEAAIEFSNTFYELLAEGAPVETAVAEARQAISLGLSGKAEWGTPVFYTHAPDSVLFEIEREIDGRAGQSPATSGSTPRPASDPPSPGPEQDQTARPEPVEDEDLYAHENLIRLRNMLQKSFSEEELKTLCFDLKIDYENLAGRGKAGKVRELVDYVKRHRRMADLIEVGRVSRPELPWLQIAVSPPSDSEQDRPNLNRRLVEYLQPEKPSPEPVKESTKRREGTLTDEPTAEQDTKQTSPQPDRATPKATVEQEETAPIEVRLPTPEEPDESKELPKFKSDQYIETKEIIGDLSYDLSNFRRIRRKLTHTLRDKRKIVNVLASLMDADEDVTQWKAALLILSIDEDVPDQVQKKARTNLFQAVENKAEPNIFSRDRNDRDSWDNPDTRSVMSKLQEQGGDDVVDFFIEIAESDKHHEIRIAAIDGLKAFDYQNQDAKVVMELFIEIAESDSLDEIRIAAIDGLKALKYPNIEDLMVKLAQSAGNGKVRLKAVKVLQELDHEVSMDLLVKMAEDDRDGTARLAAIKTLQEINYEGSIIDLLVKMAQDGRCFFDRHNAIKALQELDYEGSIDLLASLAKEDTIWDPSKDRIDVLNTLRELKYKGSVDLFKELAVDDDKDYVRLAAIKNLHELGVDDFYEDLEIMVGSADENEDIRKFAKEWLDRK